MQDPAQQLLKPWLRTEPRGPAFLFHCPAPSQGFPTTPVGLPSVTPEHLGGDRTRALRDRKQQGGAQERLGRCRDAPGAELTDLAAGRWEPRHRRVVDCPPKGRPDATVGRGIGQDGGVQLRRRTDPTFRRRAQRWPCTPAPGVGSSRQKTRAREAL